MALNQAIYVFTVVTVLFTPVSFLAVSDITVWPSITAANKEDFLGVAVLEQPSRGH
jgi:hypothetical protein